MKMKMLKLTASIATLTALAGCTYNSTTPVSASYDVYSNYSDKVTGRYALYVDGGEFSGDFKPQGYNCSFHTFSQDASSPFEQSVVKTFENLVDYIEPVDNPMAGSDLAMRGLDGQIVVEAEDMDVRIKVIPGFWSSDMEADVDLAAKMTVDSLNGRLLGTAVSGDGDAMTGAGSACGGGADAMAQATSDALEELMQRLGERLTNSPRIREQAGL